MQNVLLLAVPFFLILIGIEAWVLRRRGVQKGYDFNETFANLSCGLGQQVVDIAFKILIFFYSLVTVGLILERARDATRRELLRIALFVVGVFLLPDPEIAGWFWMELSLYGVSLCSLLCVVYYRWVLAPRWRTCGSVS